jgi:hypothetical protein
VERWLYFLRHGPELDTETLPDFLDTPVIRNALEELAVLSQDELERDQYESRLKFLRDQQAYVDDALEIGEVIGEIRLSQRLLGDEITPKEELRTRPLGELARLRDELAARMNGRDQ